MQQQLEQPSVPLTGGDHIFAVRKQSDQQSTGSQANPGRVSFSAKLGELLHMGAAQQSTASSSVHKKDSRYFELNHEAREQHTGQMTSE